MHLGPACAVSNALQADTHFAPAVAKWLGRGQDVTREAAPPDSQWEFVRARMSVLTLLAAADQQTTFNDWFGARAKELVEDGVIARVAAASAAVITSAAVASDPSDGPDGEPGATSGSEG